MMMGKFIELTTWETYGNSGGKKGGRMYINKDNIIEVHEASSGSHCTLIVRSGRKDPELYQVADPFEVIKALMDYEPEVADIVRKGNEL